MLMVTGFGPAKWIQKSSPLLFPYSILMTTLVHSFIHCPEADLYELVVAFLGCVNRINDLWLYAKGHCNGEWCDCSFERWYRISANATHEWPELFIHNGKGALLDSKSPANNQAITSWTTTTAAAVKLLRTVSSLSSLPMWHNSVHRTWTRNGGGYQSGRMFEGSKNL